MENEGSEVASQTEESTGFEDVDEIWYPQGSPDGQYSGSESQQHPDEPVVLVFGFPWSVMPSNDAIEAIYLDVDVQREAGENVEGREEDQVVREEVEWQGVLVSGEDSLEGTQEYIVMEGKGTQQWWVEDF